MENTVNEAVQSAAAAGAANEPAGVFGFAPEGQTQFAFAPEGAGTVDASRSAEPQGGELRDEGDNGETHSEQAQPTPDNQTRHNDGTAFRNERLRQQKRYQREYEEKLASDPLRLVGQRLVDDLVNREGMTQEQAVNAINNRFFEAMAQREGISPAVARMLYQQQQAAAQSERNQPTQSQDGTFQGETQTPEARANEIVTELAEMQMPDGFDFNAAKNDPSFVELLLENSPQAAVRIYHAEQRLKAAEQRAANAPQEIADRLRSRSSIPQSTKPAAVSAKPNFGGMTSEEFWAWDAQNS